jgi:serine/threonine-protein kinase
MELGKEMSTKIGHFEILSELSKSPTGAVYKANDPESGQTIALKAIQLSAFGDSAAALEQALLAEAEKTKVLSSPNITPVVGAGEIEGQFCAAMEYVQGNSIATMLARKEGFSIWDLLDIGRQLCGGLDYATSKQIVHYSLEPGKIMCGWDGTVRILSFGVSSVGNFVLQVPIGVPTILHYMSPEQVLGQTMDGRSNLFSLGAMFYEMVTERKAFDREDMETLRQSILESAPVPPIQVNPKVHPLLSDLIMKALAKDPAQRYQTGRELLADLEKCKEAKPVAKKPEAPKSPVAPAKVNTAVQGKFVTPAAAKPAVGPARPAAASSTTPQSGLARPSTPVAPPAAKSALAKPAEKKPAAPVVSSAERSSALAKPASKLARPKAAAAAAAAGLGVSDVPSSPESQELDLSTQPRTSSVAATTGDAEQPYSSMSSAAVEEPQIETFEPQEAGETPKIAVDPLMAEGGPTGSSGVSFSDMTELPPLKEVYIAPPPPPAPVEPVQVVAPAVTTFRGVPKAPEKPKVQPREVAQKAIKEIKGVPPKLMLYALGAAGALILAICIGVTVYIHSQSSDDDSGASRPTASAQAPAQPDAEQPVPKKSPAPAPAPVVDQPAETPQPEAATAEPVATSKSRNSRKKAAPVAPAIVLGQLTVESTPQGAQVQIDGRSDPSWVTPLAMTGIQPGQHSITVIKAGYSTDTRTVTVNSGSRATTTVRLAQLAATVIVKSNPPGANIYVDGRDVGPKTPAQVSVDKGQHVILVRMAGYLDETMSAQFVSGQTFNFAPSLRALGNTDNIRTVGKMSKLFGGKSAQAGQAIVSIHTQPKGAQIAINQHMLEKMSPVEVALDPGSYVIDITLTGYAPVHKIITVDKGDKTVLDEVLQRQ